MPSSEWQLDYYRDWIYHYLSTMLKVTAMTSHTKISKDGLKPFFFGLMNKTKPFFSTQFYISAIQDKGDQQSLFRCCCSTHWPEISYQWMESCSLENQPYVTSAAMLATQ